MRYRPTPQRTMGSAVRMGPTGRKITACALHGCCMMTANLSAACTAFSAASLGVHLRRGTHMRLHDSIDPSVVPSFPSESSETKSECVRSSQSHSRAEQSEGKAGPARPLPVRRVLPRAVAPIVPSGPPALLAAPAGLLFLSPAPARASRCRGEQGFKRGYSGSCERRNMETEPPLPYASILERRLSQHSGTP
jgi:hypothetical protein